MTPLPLWIGAYLLGSIPTGYWLGRAWKGIDIRQHGSGNLGATNVFRVLGKAPGMATLCIDIAKGALPVLFCQRRYPGDLSLAAAVGLAAIAGHATSVFVRFRGGKGVATSAGVFLALLPLPSLIAIAIFFLSLYLTRFVSLSSMLAAAGLAAAAFVLSPERVPAWAAAAMACFVIWTHRSNIRRLRDGTESRFQWTKKESAG